MQLFQVQIRLEVTESYHLDRYMKCILGNCYALYSSQWTMSLLQNLPFISCAAEPNNRMVLVTKY